MIPELHHDALWRFSIIEPMVQPDVTHQERNRLVRKQSRLPVTWPSGRVGPVAKATLYRWIGKYLKGRLPALAKKPKPPPRPPGGLPKEQIEYAIALLEEEPGRSLFMLQTLLKAHFKLLAWPSRSSLYRAICLHSRFKTIARLRPGKKKFRRRWVPQRVHQIWILDAKGPFKVRLASGQVITVTILSIMEAHSRYILAGRVAKSEALAPLIGAFRSAGLRYGLPESVYPDRGAPYDAEIFRQGWAVLGIHRVNAKPRNPPARGKIERYHRLVVEWFVRELPHQPVRDLEHLQDLFDAFLDQVYHEHVHRELKTSIREAFGGQLSKRQVSLDDLHRAFLIVKKLTVDHTSSIRVQGTLFHIPSEFRPVGKKITAGLDPEKRFPPCLITVSGQRIGLKPALEPASKPPAKAKDPEPAGSLTPLLERYRGRNLPNAQGGFGLPEIYGELAVQLGRPLPASDMESRTVIAFLKAYGPFQPEPFRSTLHRVVRLHGSGRPLSFILEALAKEIRPIRPKEIP